MIGRIIYFVCAIWFAVWEVKFLFIAARRGYVMALTRPFIDATETPQTRLEQPQKFWANVVVALVLLPLAVCAVYFSASDLWVAIHKQGI
jgi:Mg2+/citrate symporter